MAIVFIEEVGGPLRVCSKQATAEALGVAWADIDVSALSYPTECYTLTQGAPVLLPAAAAQYTDSASKAARDTALAALAYDLGDGRIIQCRPKDEPNFERAYKVFSLAGVTHVDWVMQDDTKHPVTEAELRAAHNYGILAGAQIWAEYPGK